MRSYRTASLLFLMAVVSQVRADVLVWPTPTFVADSAYLGFPAGPIIGLALAAATVTSFLGLRKQGFRMWTAVPICVLVYLLLNLGVYALAANHGLIQPQPAGATRRFQIPAPSPNAAPK